MLCYKLLLFLGSRMVGSFMGASCRVVSSLMFHSFEPRTSQDGGAAVREVSLPPPAAGPGSRQSRGFLLPESGLNLTAYILRLGCVAVKTTIDPRLGKDSNCGLLSVIAILSSSQLPWLSHWWLFLVVWVPNRYFVRKRMDVDGKPRQPTSIRNEVACYPLTRASSIRS